MKELVIKKTLVVLVLILSLCIVGCWRGDSDALKQAKKLQGGKIEFPTEYLSVAISDSILPIEAELTKSFRIVTYLDQNSCSECALKILRHWQELLAEIPQHISVGFVPVVYPSDTTELKKALHIHGINFSLLYDKENKYIKTNNLEEVFARNRSFLLNAENQIIIVGEPLVSANLWQVYKNALDKLNP